MLLRHSLDLSDEAAAIESAVANTLETGLVTPDLAAAENQVSTTQHLTDAIVAALH